MIKIKLTYKIVIISLIFIFSLLIMYYMFESILLSILLSCYVIILATLLLKYKEKYENKIKQVNDMCEFILLMNTKKTNEDLITTYHNVENYLPADFININDEEFFEQLVEISNIYKFNCFKFYVFSLIKNDLNNSINLCYSVSKKVKELDKIKKQKLSQINYLFILWISIMVFIKLFVPDYYHLMISNNNYLLPLILMMFVGVSCYFVIAKQYIYNFTKGI